MVRETAKFEKTCGGPLRQHKSVYDDDLTTSSTSSSSSSSSSASSTSGARRCVGNSNHNLVKQVGPIRRPLNSVNSNNTNNDSTPPASAQATTSGPQLTQWPLLMTNQSATSILNNSSAAEFNPFNDYKLFDGGYSAQLWSPPTATQVPPSPQPQPQPQASQPPAWNSVLLLNDDPSSTITSSSNNTPTTAITSSSESSLSQQPVTNHHIKNLWLDSSIHPKQHSTN